MRALAVLASLLLTGCLGDLDRASTVHDLRVLAVRTEPPDLVLGVPAGLTVDAATDVAGLFAGGQISGLTPVAISALIGDAPAAGRPLSYRITTCPEPEHLRCEGLEGALVLQEGTVLPDPAAAGLGTAIATLISAEQLEALPALLQKAIEKDPYRGFGGLPLFLGVHVWAEDGEEVFGGGRIPIWLPTVRGADPLRPTEPPFVVSQIPGLQPNGLPQAPEILFDGIVALPGDRPAVRRSMELDVFPPSAPFEEYVVPLFRPDPDGSTVRRLHETWTYSWFTTKGYFSPEMSGGYDPLEERQADARVHLELPSDAEPGDLAVVAVVRDGRGGETWTIRTAIWPGP